MLRFCFEKKPNIAQGPVRSIPDVEIEFEFGLHHLPLAFLPKLWFIEPIYTKFLIANRIMWQQRFMSLGVS